MDKQKLMLSVGIILVLVGVLVLIFVGKEPAVGKATAGVKVSQESEKSEIIRLAVSATGTFTETKSDSTVTTEGTITPEITRLRTRATPQPLFAGVLNQNKVLVNRPNPFPTDEFTVALWMKATVQPTAQSIVADAGGWTIGNDGNDFKSLSFSVVDLQKNRMAVRTPIYENNLGEWVHLAAVFKNKNPQSDGFMKLYLNGVEVDKKTFTDPVFLQSSNLLALGALAKVDSTDQPWEGSLADFRLYNKALEPTHIFSLYLDSFPPEPTDYVAKWDFEESSGTVVKDDNGRYSGTLVTSTANPAKRVAIREGTTTPSKSLSFSGAPNNAVEVKDASNQLPTGLRITNELTVSAWVKAARRPINGMAVVSTSGWLFGNDGSGGSDSSSFSFMGAKDNNFFTKYVDEWVQVVGTMKAPVTVDDKVVDKGFTKLYVNGKLVSPIDIPGVILTYDPDIFLRLGALASAKDPIAGMWEGEMDDVRIYDRALDSLEVKGFFENSIPPDCLNRFCPSRNEILQAAAETLSTLLPLLLELPVVQKNDRGDIVNLLPPSSTVTDIINDKTAVFRFLSNAFPPVTSLDFAASNKNYQLQLAAQDAAQATAQVQVKDIFGKLLGTLDLSSTEEEPLGLQKAQQPLDFNGDGTPEAYLQSFGFFNEEGQLGLLAGVTPLVNFDIATPWVVSFLSQQPQQFLLDGELHSAVGATGGSFILAIDGEEHRFGDAGESYPYKLDALGKKTVKVTLLKLKGDLAIFSFERIPAGLEQEYEATLTQKKTLTIAAAAGETERVLHICTPEVATLDAVKVCEVNTEKFDLLNGRPEVVETFKDILFSYEKPAPGQPKEVKALHLFDFDAKDNHEFAIYFANNLVEGKRLALKSGGRYYLLEMQDKSKAYLELTNLKLTKIIDPDDAEIDKSKPTYSPLGNQEIVRFNLPLQQQINVRLETIPQLKYVIQRTSSAVPEIVNLVNNMQASVSTYGSVGIHDMKSKADNESLLHNVSIDPGDVDVNNGDISSDNLHMKIRVGKKSEKAIELSLNTPTPLTRYSLFDGSETPPLSIRSIGNAGVLALYNKFTPAGTVERPQFTKYADLYLLYNFIATRNHAFTDLEFILPLLKGNKLAVQVDSDFYLLYYAKPWSGAVTGGFNREELRLVKFDAFSKTFDTTKSLLPQISEDGATITFVLGTGTVSVQLTISTTTATISLSKVSTDTAVSSVAKEVNLLNEFQATLTTFNPLKLLESIDTLSISPQDSAFLPSEMQIAVKTTTDTVVLKENVPRVIGSYTEAGDFSSADVLILYDDFSFSNGLYTKSADMYLLYDLNSGEKFRPFTAEAFITPLVEQAKQFAVKYKDKFYLLSYSGTSAQGFRYNKLRLKPLLGGSAVTPSVKENMVSFTVPEGTITLDFDTMQRRVTLRGILQVPAEFAPGSRSFDPVKEYSTLLPLSSSTPGADNVLTIGTTKIYNCDVGDVVNLESVVDVCMDALEPAVNVNRHVDKGVPVFLTTSAGNVLLTYREKSGNSKKVTVQQIIGSQQVPTTTDSFIFSAEPWQQFSGNLAASKFPVIELIELEDTNYFELVGSGPLDSLKLRSIASGKEYTAKKLTVNTEEHQEMEFAVDQKVLLFTRELDPTSKVFVLSMKWLVPALVTVEGINEKVNVATDDSGKLKFIPALGAPTYTLALQGVTHINTDTENAGVVLINITDERATTIFRSYIPEKKNKSILLPTGEVVTLDVVAVNEDSTGASLKLHK